VALKLEAALIANNLTSYQKMIYSGDPTSAIRNLLQSDIRIFVIVRIGSMEDPGKRFECVLKQLGAYGPKYFWIQVGLPFTTTHFEGSCPDSDRAESLEGSIETDTAVMDPALIETRIGPAGKTLPELYRQFLIEYPARLADARMKTIRGFDLRFDSVMSAALALNQTLQSWNYSDEMQLGNSSFKAELMKNILKLDFIGLSGRVVFDSNGDRTSVVMIYQLRNLSRHLVGTYDPIENVLNWTAKLWFAGGSPPVDAPELLTRQLQLSEAGTIALSSASSIGIAVSIATVAVNFHYRELRLIKMSSPLVNNVIGAGCLMCYASCIVMAVNSHWAVSTGLCWTQTALLTIGYSAAFGAMLAKTWRVHRIFTNVKLRRVAIKDSHLFAVILLVLATDIVLLIAWGIIDPLTVKSVSLPSV
uniref:G_PROTEIN_RECEP_F3_4 domain-containing protein n=1 Tax=Macrostomum lignano TaxID=282301 RepID=A0A1I8HSG6_9PLAT